MKTDDVVRMIDEMKQRFFKVKEDESKYKFSRNWYVADIRDEDYYAVREWCIEHFGPEDKFPSAWSRWQHRYEHQIFIRDQEDYVIFVLRWGKA
jgi:hypothetical protein